MHYEFALEPQLLSSWKDFRFFVSQFGWQHGRLISRYPKRWKRHVYESLSDVGDVEKTRIEEALRRIDDRLMPRLHEWSPQLSSWLENAEDEHGKRPFKAIVASLNPRSHDDVILADRIDDTTDYAALEADDPLHKWNAPRSEIVRRTAAEMAETIRALLVQCKRVLFIDKHFGPENPRHRRPLEKFLSTIAARETGSAPESVEVHTGNAAERTFFTGACDSRLAGITPSGLTLRLVRWNSTELHNRFVVTDCGGVAFLEGLDEFSGSGRSEDVVVILDQSVCEQLLQDYDSTSTACKYTFIDEHTVAGTKTV